MHTKTTPFLWMAVLILVWAIALATISGCRPAIMTPNPTATQSDDPTRTKHPQAEATATATPAPPPTVATHLPSTLSPPIHPPLNPPPAGNAELSFWIAPDYNLWAFDQDDARLIDLQLEVPRDPLWYYESHASHGRLIYVTRRPAEIGAGPGNVAVTDLGVFDIPTKQMYPVVSDEVVVEAAWAPDGEHLAYVRATRETYELRWRSLTTGEDRLLALDVAFTISVSPSGQWVAFTREAGYGLQVEPGLYVVSIPEGEERRIATSDRAGKGSITDRPHWSPDESLVLPTLHDGLDNRGLLRASMKGDPACE